MAAPDAKTRPSPVLQPGRPADPVQPPAPAEEPTGTGELTGTPATVAGAEVAKNEAEGAQKAVPAPDDASQDESADASAEKKHAALLRQGNHRRLLRQCERVLLLDFNTLAIPDWPDNFTMASARRRRDVWLFSASLAAIVFLAGVPGLAPAWVAGTGFGAFVLIGLSGIPVVRRLFSSKPSYIDLLIRRQQRLREAKSHIQHLEGDEGLAWQCAMMAEFNSALRSTRFSNLISLSEKRTLARQLRRREHIRLYLIFLLEAEKAYDRLQNSYFEGHQYAIDQGWTAPEKEIAQEAAEEAASQHSGR